MQAGHMAYFSSQRLVQQDSVLAVTGHSPTPPGRSKRPRAYVEWVWKTCPASLKNALIAGLEGPVTFSLPRL